jgi:hypothetical protein
MKKIFIVASLIVFSNTLYSQGFIWDKKVAAHHKTYERVGLSRALLPTSISLEKYLPYIQHQGSIGMCAAYSIATCRTIVYARNNNLTDINKISAESYSPYYTYQRVLSTRSSGKWGGGLMPYMNKINDFGYAKIKDIEYPYYYPFTSNHLWDFAVPTHFDLDIESVKEDKFDYIVSILPTENIEDTVSDLIRQIKVELSKEIPILFGMSPMPSILAAVGGNGEDYWDNSIEVECEQCSNLTNDISGLCKEHKKDWKGQGHAMVLIGYDDEKYGGSFQIVNSWGEDWGDNGKIWIKYEDFVEHAKLMQSLDKENKITMFDDVKSNSTFSDNSCKSEGNLETKDFTDYVNDKWMLSVPVYGLSAGQYSGKMKDGKRNGFGTHTLLNGSKYVGDWKDDKMHGEGTYTINNYQYKGKFNDGNFNGNGSLIILNLWGDTLNKFEGEFEDGKFINGVVIEEDRGFYSGYRYVGEYKLGKRNGYGYYSSYEDDYMYVGEFKDGKMHGQGNFTWPSGNKYTGEWSDDKRSGQGTKTYTSGEKYVGTWEDNLQNGQGVYTTNKYTYEGGFRDFYFYGQGKKTYVDGTIEEGEWKDDMMHGQGKKTYVDGTIEEGEWNEGILVTKNIILKIESLLNSILRPK